MDITLDSLEFVASPVLLAFFKAWNLPEDDGLSRKVSLFFPKLVGTDDGNDDLRAWIATDWLVRVSAPAWLDLADLPEYARTLRLLEPINDYRSAQSVQNTVFTIEDVAIRREGSRSRPTNQSVLNDPEQTLLWFAAHQSGTLPAIDAAWAAVSYDDWETGIGNNSPWVSFGKATWACLRAAVAVDANGMQQTVSTLQNSAFLLADTLIKGQQ